MAKLTTIVTHLWTLGEEIDESVVASQLLRAAPVKYNAITSSMEQLEDLNSMTLDDAIGSLKIHED